MLAQSCRSFSTSCKLWPDGFMVRPGSSRRIQQCQAQNEVASVSSESRPKNVTDPAKADAAVYQGFQELSMSSRKPQGEGAGAAASDPIPVPSGRPSQSANGNNLYWEELLHSPEQDGFARARSARDAAVLRRKGHLKEQDKFIGAVSNGPN